MSECQIENGVKCVTHDSYDLGLRCSVRIAKLERDLATAKEQGAYWYKMCSEAREDLAAAEVVMDAERQEQARLIRERDVSQARVVSLTRALATRDSEVSAVIESIPGAIRVRESNGPENIYASLAVSVAKALHDLAATQARLELVKQDYHSLCVGIKRRDEDLAAAKARIAVLKEEDRVWGKHSLVQIVRERGELQERVKELTEALQPFASGGQWGTWKAFLVHGPATKEAGIAAAKQITHWQVSVDAVLTPAKETTSLQQGVDAVSPPDRQVVKSDDAAKETA